MPGWRVVADEPEMWASILGWHCWRGAAGFWYARRMGASPAVVLRSACLDTLRAAIGQRNRSRLPHAGWRHQEGLDGASGPAGIYISHCGNADPEALPQ